MRLLRAFASGFRSGLIPGLYLAVGIIAGYVMADYEHDHHPDRWVIAEDVESVNPAGKSLLCTFAASLGDEPRLYITECHDP